MQSATVTLFCAVIICCIHVTFSEQPKVKTYKHQQQPLVFKTWPPQHQRQMAALRNGGLMIQLRGAGSTNVVQRMPAPGDSAQKPYRFVRPSLLTSPSSQIFFKQPSVAALKRPYTASMPTMLKFISPSHKSAAIKFQSYRPYSFVSSKFSQPSLTTLQASTDGAIHTIPAPNLSLNDAPSSPSTTLNVPSSAATIHLNQLDQEVNRVELPYYGSIN